MAFPLDVTTELYLDGAWTDITADTYQRDGIQVVRGRADESAGAEPSNCALTLDNRSGDYSPRNPLSAYYGTLGRNTALRVRTPTTEPNYLALPGGSPLHVGRESAYASTPDAAALDITGDIDIRVDVLPYTWRPPGPEGYGLAQKMFAGSTLSRSWSFYLRSDGYLSFSWSPDGTFGARKTAVSTVTVDADSPRLALRVTLDVDTGGGLLHEVKFWTDTNIDGGYTQLGDPVTSSGATSIFAGTGDLEVGRVNSFGILSEEALFQGKIYRAQVRSGIGGALVASPDFTAQDSGDTSFTDAQGRVWTLQGRATMANPGARFHGEVSAWPQRWDKADTDVYTPLQAYGVMRRLGQGAPLRSAMYRGVTSLSNVVAYWPAEDSEGANELASALPGYPPMLHLSGAIENASFDGFKASDPLPLAGQVQWTGTVPAYTYTGLTQVRFLMAVPSGGVGSTGTICRVFGYGTSPWWKLNVNTAGDLRLLAYDHDDVIVADSGFDAWHEVNGKLLLVSIELEHTGPDVNWTFTTTQVGTDVTTSTSGTLAGRTMGRVRRVVMNVEDGLPDSMAEVALGHISVQNDITPMIDADYSLLNAYAGERATARVLRLCHEEDVPVTIIGNNEESTALGPQLPASLLDLLREVADADLGILYEPREFLGLAYRARGSLYAQTAALTLDYSTGVLFSIEPTEDDQDTRNDVTVTRAGGSSARVELTTGALSVKPPPAGVGRYDEDVTISVASDEDLPDQASWRLHLGTVDEARYPVLGVNLASPSFTGDAALTLDAQRLDVGDLLVVTNPPAWLPPEDIGQLAQGFTESLGQYEWLIDVNCSPGSPWNVALWDDEDDSGPGQDRYSSDGTSLATAAPAHGSALLLNGVTPGRAATPDTAALDITGDIDLRAHVAMDDWTPATTNRALVSKWSASKSFILLVVATTGRLRMQWTSDNVTTRTADSTVSPAVADGGALWVRATLDVDNGAAGRDVKFYTSTDGETWTQLGTTVTQAGVTSIYSGSAALIAGATSDGAVNTWPGRVSAVEVRNGIDGSVVANPDFGAQPAGTTSFTDAAGLTWTLYAPAVIADAAPGLFLDTVSVSTPTGPVWSGVDAPFDITVGGERMTVTAVSGSGSAQVFTVTRSVNGIAKSHAAGADVELFEPAIYAL